MNELRYNKDIKVVLRGKNINFTNETGYPIIADGRTLLPVRIVAEKLGFKVDYISSLESISLTKDDIEIGLAIWSNIVYVNHQQAELDCATIIHNGRAYVPIRFLAENIGMKVEWNGTTKTIKLSGGV